MYVAILVAILSLGIQIQLDTDILQLGSNLGK